MLSFYILFLIPSFLIHPHKLFSMQLGPGTTSLAYARLIVPFAPFIANLSASLKISLPYQAVYYYLLDNPVSGPSFVPTVIAALHPSNSQVMICTSAQTITFLYIRTHSLRIRPQT